MARAIILLLFFSHLSFAGDNTVNITYKGSGSSITSIQEGNSNTTTILCGAGSSGTVPGSSYVAHTCTGAVWNVDVEGNSNTVKMYTVWSNHTNSRNTITIDGNDNSAYIDQDEDDNVSSITQTGNTNIAEQLGTGDDNVYAITQTGNNKYAKIFAFGDDSDITITQSGTGAHNAYVFNANYADNNSATIVQSDSGNKDADIFFYADSDNTDVDLTQTGSGAHTANMKFYTDDYDVDVTQSGATNQSYSATFNCTSSCTKTISITQQ